MTYVAIIEYLKFNKVQVKSGIDAVNVLNRYLSFLCMQFFVRADSSVLNSKHKITIKITIQ